MPYNPPKKLKVRGGRYGKTGMKGLAENKIGWKTCTKSFRFLQITTSLQVEQEIEYLLSGKLNLDLGTPDTAKSKRVTELKQQRLGKKLHTSAPRILAAGAHLNHPTVKPNMQQPQQAHKTIQL